MLRALICSILLLAPVDSFAASIFLNGVNIDGVTNQVFDNCKVEIDAYGNIRITAKGFAVQAPGTPTPNPLPAPGGAVAPGGTPVRRYWLVTEKVAPGMSQYDIDLFINGKWVRKFLDSEEHVVMELTKYLVTGPNKVNFVAKKDLSSARRSSSPQHYFRIVVGEGDSGGRNVMITRKVVDYKRTALETKDYAEEFPVVIE